MGFPIALIAIDNPNTIIIARLQIKHFSVVDLHSVCVNTMAIKVKMIVIAMIRISFVFVFMSMSPE